MNLRMAALMGAALASGAPVKRPDDAIGPWSPPADPLERLVRGRSSVHDSVVLDADDVARIDAAARKRDERAAKRLRRLTK